MNLDTWLQATYMHDEGTIEAWFPSLPSFGLDFLDKFCDGKVYKDQTIGEAEMNFESDLQDYVKTLDNVQLGLCIQEISTDTLKSRSFITDTRKFLEECSVAHAMEFLRLTPSFEFEDDDLENS